MGPSRTKPSIVYWLGNNLYLNITNRCSNNCYFCIRNFWTGVGSFNLRLNREPTFSEVILVLQEVINARNWSEIVFCGFGEPMERLDLLLEVARWIGKYYAKATKVRLDTNGHGCLLNRGRDVVRELKAAGINKISVSLNAHNEEVYNRVCRPKLGDAYESVLEFIEKAKGSFDIEVTTVAIPEVNIDEVRQLAQKMGVGFRIREPVQCFL